MLQRFIIAVVVLTVMLAAGITLAASVPKYLNYQSILYDDGGNPLPDGPINLSIRILDSNMDVVFEETQEALVIGGAVSVTLGDGVHPDTNAPSGGIQTNMLNPANPKYLEVQAEGYPAEGLMELVSVPYAAYSDIALGVADGAVGSSSIKDASIEMRHLTDELVSEISDQMTSGGSDSPVVVREEFNSFKSSISSSGGADYIGVKPDFSYSASTTVQDVFKDFDLAIKKREEDVVWAKQDYSGKIDAEKGLREGGDSNLQSQIGTEQAARANADSALESSKVSISDLYDEHNIVNDAKIPSEVARDSEVATKISISDLLYEQSDVAEEGIDANQVGKIRYDKIPDGIATVAALSSASLSATEMRGRISLNIIDTEFSNIECEYSEEAGSTGGGPVVCRLSSTAYSDGICGTTRQIIPRFEISTECSVPASVGVNPLLALPIIPKDFTHWAIIRTEPHTYRRYCDELISFYVEGLAACAPGQHSTITWYLYSQNYPTVD